MVDRVRERGAAAVEFALVSLLLVSLLFGIVEFGRAWYAQATISGAAREGVRVLALNSGSNGPGLASAAAASYLPAGLSDATPVPGPACPENNVSGQIAWLEVRYPFRFIVPGIFGAGFTLVGRGEMRCNG